MTQTPHPAAPVRLADAPAEHVDVLIVGAGLSGIGAAYHLQDKLPGSSYAILEGRDAIGGTWDLFRYPGIRSDSDMFTLGYRFKPWTQAKAIADGPAILEYVTETAREHGIDRHIRFGHRVVSAAWSTDEARWTVTAQRTDTGEEVRLTCDFFFCASGYYRYDEGFTPTFDGIDRFRGQLVHPQHWPEDLDYAGKRVAVIGSGATAVTLVPAMTDKAAHVTMLQRSPTYIMAVPGEDPIAKALRRRLPARAAYTIVRWKNVAVTTALYRASRRWPNRVRKLIRSLTVKQLPHGYDVDTHFKPKYDPWDQRLCVVPRGDLFEAIREGKASIATDHIETFTENGIRLASGTELEADVVVTATGLNLLAFGGMQLSVDGREVDLSDTMAYKGMMLSDVPNFAFAIGYTNASWTLKVDLVAEYVCRLLKHLQKTGTKICVPHNEDPSVTPQPLLDFQAGYVLRSLDAFPRQGSKAPWRLSMSYPRDLMALRFGSITDDGMRFTNPPARTAPAPPPAARAA
ncbi:MAG TPA: NAD(P)/FAD-dependent oxidoreductase [Baekduia sp.]|nr:NAD(P)/FAD-dependent oxidoreductase [Baekduia sp.]